jgi:signal peptidase I
MHQPLHQSGQSDVRPMFWRRGDRFDRPDGAGTGPAPIKGKSGVGAHRRRLTRLCGLTCAAGLGLFHLLCPFSIGIVQGSSMTPTFRPGQFFLLDRGYYRDHPIQRGDVVVVRSGGHTMIKRVFAVGGDSLWLLIQADENRIDRFIVELDLVERMRRATLHSGIGRLTRLKVPPGTVYLLGDCTEASIDSRSFGVVSTQEIIGRVRPWRPGAGSVAIHNAGA